MGVLNDQIQTILHDFGILLPEGVLVLGSFVLILLQLYFKNSRTTIKITFSLFLLGMIALAIAHSTVPGVYFDGLITVIGLTGGIKVLFILVVGLVLLFPDGEALLQRGEYHFLIFMILLGAMLLIAVNHLLLFYLALELVSITSYILINFNFEKRSFEAGIKYLLFGAVASGLMLYGISLLYGLTGSLLISAMGQVGIQAGQGTWLAVASMLFFVGIWFKLALVPMHSWTPDAYEAGPTPVVALISVVPKVAVLLFFSNFVLQMPLDAMGFDWKMIFSVVAILSMFVGNLSALIQTDAKRMMAYSSIAHAGVMTVGIIVGSEFGIQAMIFYAVVYAFMNLGAFYVIDMFKQKGYQKIRDLAGLGRQAPWLGVGTLLIMIALVGLPPTGGFTAKLFIFSSLWDYYQSEGSEYLVWLFGLGVLNAAISLFYYLKIPYYLFMHASPTEKKVFFSAKDGTIVAVVVFFVLLLFFKADLLLNVLNQFNFAL